MIFSRGAKKAREPPRERTLSIAADVRDGILSYSKMRHPNEAILILRGGSKGAHVTVDGLVIPPFSHSGPTFAGFPHSFLPFDKSYVGMFHSHPSGTARPSVTDLHNFFGLVSVIVAYPYAEADICAWDSSGGAIRIVDAEPA